ncbi:hypothetical protein ATY48_11970 [Xanthomonas oryzae pv. oryzae]|uniref:hypothetical protein n=1 Tax=Xanthomonas oryzae TaxID=347 RepID=UPI000859973B|nr:hypothetical protein [Xanthomonas oryzae]AOS27607.1 hypothetical protein ATY48_11970 [Xanthomonas oryzae pv. oryzae]
MLQAIYASESLHVQVASHWVLQVLHDIRNAVQAALWLMTLHISVKRNLPLAALSLAPVKMPSHTACGSWQIHHLPRLHTDGVRAPVCHLDWITPLRPAPDVGLP